MKNILKTFWLGIKLVTVSIVITVLLITIDCWYKENYTSFIALEKRYTKMYERLKLFTQQSPPPFYYVQSDTVSAYVNTSSVVLYSGMAEFAENDHQVAMVLAHEIAHYELGHVLSYRGQAIQIMREAMADKLSVYYMEKAGYDVCKGLLIWKKMIKKYGDKPYYSNHPSSSYRLEALRLGRCK